MTGDGAEVLTETLQPETCFACGTKNPHGLHVTFRKNPSGGAIGLFTPTEHHEGWPGVVHGGILATLLDEAMAYALWFSHFRAVTVRMETRYRRSISAGQSVTITAHVLGERRSVIDARGRVAFESGDVMVAEASGRFMVADVSY